MTNEPYVPDDGVLISEFVETLRRIGYDVSAQQLRKYEDYGLFKPQKTSGKYRLYDRGVIHTITLVYQLKLVGFSLKKIKEFLALKSSVLKAKKGSGPDSNSKAYFTQLCGDVAERFRRLQIIGKAAEADAKILQQQAKGE